MDQKPQSSGQRVSNAPAKRPPLYELGKEGHYGACLQVYNQGQAPNPDSFTGNWANINQGLTGNHREILSSYWQQQLRSIEDDDHDYKNNHLPLARIKKVMKADPEVKMISAEAPILFAKGCDIFITEVTMRAWIHAEENKRRTLQRSDIASALMKSDMYDFLIDIVPREDATGSSHSKRPAGQPSTTAAAHPQTQQAPVSQQAPPQHAQAPGYGGFQPPMGADNDYRAPSLYVPHGQADPAYGHPQQQMFDSSMYSAYPMPPQQIPYPIQRPQVLNQGLDPNRHHYRSHEAGEADAESDRDFVVG